jgi:hypothetical protein
MITTQQAIIRYGFPKDAWLFNYNNLPYPMRLSWDIDVKVNKITCHKLVAENFTNVFNDILKNTVTKR